MTSRLKVLKVDGNGDCAYETSTMNTGSCDSWDYLKKFTSW